MIIMAGATGKSFQDRERSAKVRNLVLDAIEKVYKGKGDGLSERQWELTLRMATTVLPRLNEHSGPDGEPIPLLNYVRNNNGNPKDLRVEKKDTSG